MAKSEIKYIDLVQPSGRTCALGYNYRREDPAFLNVVGGLDHQSQIQPKTIADAEKMISWMKNWIEAQS